MKRFFLWGLVLVLLLGFTWSAAASPATQMLAYALRWWSVDSGGGQSSAGAYSLYGSLGLPDAGTYSGGSYTLRGGFIAGRASRGSQVFMPILIRD